jgi:hypothetical protein
MARDLYGEMLSRALNRGAPQGHFAAYIQPNEAAFLRSQGGGVAPGGGQYMANGVPSYQTGAMAGVSAGSVRGGPRDFFGRGGGRGQVNLQVNPVSQRYLSVLSGAQASRNPRDASGGDRVSAPAAQVAGTSSGPYGVSPSAPISGPSGPPSVLAGEQAKANAIAAQANAKAANAEVARNRDQALEALQNSPEYRGRDKGALEVQVANQYPSAFSKAEMQIINLAAIEAAGGDQESTAAAIARPISEDGAGKYSPAAKLASQGAGWGDIYHVMQRSPTGGYAINDPQSRVSVPRGFNMGIFPAVAGTLAGFVHPLIGLATAITGFPTLPTMAKQRFELEGTPLGDILSIPSAIGSALTKPFTGLMGDAAPQIGAGIGDFLPEPDGARERTVIPRRSAESRIPAPEDVLPPGEADEDEVAPGTEPEPFATDVSSDILARLDFTSKEGRRRLEELGLLA